MTKSWAASRVAPRTSISAPAACSWETLSAARSRLWLEGETNTRVMPCGSYTLAKAWDSAERRDPAGRHLCEGASDRVELRRQRVLPGRSDRCPQAHPLVAPQFKQP